MLKRNNAVVYIAFLALVVGGGALTFSESNESAAKLGVLLFGIGTAAIAWEGSRVTEAVRQRRAEERASERYRDQASQVGRTLAYCAGVVYRTASAMPSRERELLFNQVQVMFQQLRELERLIERQLDLGLADVGTAVLEELATASVILKDAAEGGPGEESLTHLRTAYRLLLRSYRSVAGATGPEARVQCPNCTHEFGVEMLDTERIAYVQRFCLQCDSMLVVESPSAKVVNRLPADRCEAVIVDRSGDGRAVLECPKCQGRCVAFHRRNGTVFADCIEDGLLLHAVEGVAT